MFRCLSIASFFNSTCLSDVQFHLKGNMVIPAHKLWLAAKSPVCNAMFCGKLAETKGYIDLPDCEYEGMLEFLGFMYTNVLLSGDNVMQVSK